MRTSILLRVCFIPLIFLCTQTATFSPAQQSASQAPGTISGTIQDPGGAALISAKVEVEPSGRQVATDNQGSFRITNLPSGDYTLTASYVGFATYTTKVKVGPWETSNVTATLKVGSEADTVMVTVPRLHGEAEAVNVERMSAEIVQVEPAGVITSLPNTNVADAIGRLPSVSLERDEGEGKYVQIRGTEPRLSTLTINGVNVPSLEVTVRNVKMDAIPSNGIERIEVFKTLAADQDADGVGGALNLVTPTAQDKPTYALDGTIGYNPLQNGFWRGGFDGTVGHRWGTDKKFGFLLGASWDRTNRGIDDLEPNQATGATDSGQNIAYVNSEDLRSYEYYRTRYGFDIGIDERITPKMSAYLKGLYADFHDYGETRVYTPSAPSCSSSDPTVSCSSNFIFARNVIDWTRIEKIQRQLKPKLKCFGVKGWFGYAVYEFPYTQRVVVECPIEGNATCILWGDWQNKVQLTKGELLHKYPGQFRRVIHKGEWIDEVRRALKDR